MPLPYSQLGRQTSDEGQPLTVPPGHFIWPDGQNIGQEAWQTPKNVISIEC